MGSHALLSASASERWLRCPPSALLCAQVEDKGSSYAQQGTDAHELCQYLLESALGHDCEDPRAHLEYLDPEMEEAAEGYAAFVMEQIQEAKQFCEDPLICVEQKLDYSKWVEGGFGTGDCVIVADDLLHIIDFKYGLGVLISSAGEDGKGNTQLKCYALGAIDTFGCLYDIKRVRLTIYQPRRSNVDSFELTVDELMDWANGVLAPIAALAYAGKGEFCAGTHCKFCKVKAQCRARSEYAMQLARYDFADPALLTDDQIADVLTKVDVLAAWADDVKEFALQSALSGTRYRGFKVVEGRSVRKYTNDADVAAIVEKEGFDPYDYKVKGVPAMTKLLGRERFNKLLGDKIVKPQGKPVLVPVSDKRPEFSTAKSDFSHLTENNVTNDNMEVDYE